MPAENILTALEHIVTAVGTLASQTPNGGGIVHGWLANASAEIAKLRAEIAPTAPSSGRSVRSGARQRCETASRNPRRRPRK